MNLTILGATGRTGRHILEQALGVGHQVSVLVRDRAKLGDANASVAITEGDLRSADDVRQAVDGADAVIYAAGPVKGGPMDLNEVAARAIVDAMNAAGVRRLVWLSGAAVKDSRDDPSVSRAVMRAVMTLFAGSLLRASERAYETIVQSGLDYTVVRPPMLADTPGGRNVHASYQSPKPIPFGRGDLASFMLRDALSDAYVGESPMLSYMERLR